MSSAESPKAAPVRRTRKSIAHLPSPDVDLDKENTEHGTASTIGAAKAAVRKGRSKSLGPGGLDALTEDAGNRGKVYVMRTLLDYEGTDCIYNPRWLLCLGLSSSQLYRCLLRSKYHPILVRTNRLQPRPRIVSHLERVLKKVV
jgi:hypothetical protein